MPNRPPTHNPNRNKDSHRPAARARGYNARWERERGLFLKLYPLCAECERQGKVSPATVVDHVIPHRGDMELFWDVGNWQPLCRSCHASKTQGGA